MIQRENYCSFPRWGQPEVPINIPTLLCSLYMAFSLPIIDLTMSFCSYLITVKSLLIACCSQNRFLNLKYTIEIPFVYFTLVIPVNTIHICILISMQMQSLVSLQQCTLGMGPMIMHNYTTVNDCNQEMGEPVLFSIKHTGSSLTFFSSLSKIPI